MHAIANRILAIAIIVLAVFLTACPGPKPPEAEQEISADGGNNTDPQWIFRDNAKPKPIAVVFIHGIFGDTKGTWSNGGPKSFFDFLHEAEGVGDQVDIYAFGFTSKMIGGGSLKIGEAAIKLNDFIVGEGIDKYDEIVFVAHSMGGLITMRELISRPELRAKVPVVVFYATPQEGSQITKIGQHLIPNDAVRQMLPIDGNDYLQQINEDWVNLKNTKPRPWMICAYEKKPVPGIGMIVQRSSASQFCDENASPIEDSDHLTLVKPDRAKHPAVIVLLNALNRFAIPPLTDTAWETTKLDTRTTPWSYSIENAGGRNTLTFRNKGSTRMPLTLTSPDPGLLAYPSAMPIGVEPGSNEAIDLVLLNPLKSSYEVDLRLGMAAPRKLKVNIPDMQKAIAQRNELEAGAAANSNAYFATAGNSDEFKLLKPNEQHEKFLTFATTAIDNRQPGLPESAKLVLAADMLNSLSLADSAGYALAKAETQDPDVAKVAGVRQLAGVVSARTGNRRVLESAPVPRVDPTVATPAAEFTTATAAQRRELDLFAENLRANPSTQAEGNVLKGDLLRAGGNEAAAASAYSKAAATKPALVLSRKASTVVTEGQQPR